MATSVQINPNKIEQVLPPQTVPFQISLSTVKPLYEFVVELLQATNKRQNKTKTINKGSWKSFFKKLALFS